jgi:hypothetical protein
VRFSHVLLGLASTPGGAVRRALLRRGILADELRDQVRAQLPPDPSPPIDLARTPLERLVQAVADDGVTVRALSTVDLFRGVLAAGDPVVDSIVAGIGGGALLLYAAAREEAAEPEPARTRIEPRRPATRRPPERQGGEPRPSAPARPAAPHHDDHVADTFEILLEIRGLLRALAQRQVDGVATPTELRVASDIEAAVATARLRMSEDRRGGIGSPRADEVAQRRFATTLRSAYLDALSAIAADMESLTARTR